MNKEEITDILREVEADLKKSANEISQSLRKANGEPTEPADSVSADSSSPASESAVGEGGAPPAPPTPEAPPADASAGGDPAAEQGQQLTPEALQAEYSQLAPEELDMHIQAALAAKEALSAAAAPPGQGDPMAPPGGDPSAGAPPMAPPGAEAGAPPMDPAMMGKDEMAANKANGGKITKSEQAMVAAILAAVEKKFDAKMAAFQKNTQTDVENLTKSITTLVSAPIRKSIAALSDLGPSLAKSESIPMSKKEVNDFISENAERMTKTERSLWLDFVANKVPASKLAPMLERLTSSK